MGVGRSGGGGGSPSEHLSWGLELDGDLLVALCAQRGSESLEPGASGGGEGMEGGLVAVSRGLSSRILEMDSAKVKWCLFDGSRTPFRTAGITSHTFQLTRA